MIYALWLLVIIIAGLFLYLSAASMIGTFLKQRRLGDDNSTYGAPEGEFRGYRD